MKSINSIEKHAYGTSKHVLCKKEGSKCNNTMKQHKKWLFLMILHKKI